MPSFFVAFLSLSRHFPPSSCLYSCVALIASILFASYDRLKSCSVVKIPGLTPPQGTRPDSSPGRLPLPVCFIRCIYNSTHQRELQALFLIFYTFFQSFWFSEHSIYNIIGMFGFFKHVGFGNISAIYDNVYPGGVSGVFWHPLFQTRRVSTFSARFYFLNSPFNFPHFILSK